MSFVPSFGPAHALMVVPALEVRTAVIGRVKSYVRLAFQEAMPASSSALLIAKFS